MLTPYGSVLGADIGRSGVPLFSMGFGGLETFVPPGATEDAPSVAANSRKRKLRPSGFAGGVYTKAVKTRVVQDITEAPGVRRSARSAGNTIDNRGGVVRTFPGAAMIATNSGRNAGSELQNPYVNFL